MVESARGANRHLTRTFDWSLHLDLPGLVAKGELAAVHLGADDLDAIGPAPREIAEDVLEGATFEAKDHGLDDFEGAVVKNPNPCIEPFGRVAGRGGPATSTREAR